MIRANYMVVLWAVLTAGLVVLSVRSIRGQTLPEVLVNVLIEGPNYTESSEIDPVRLAGDLTVVAAGILNRVSDFGFISFRPTGPGDTLDVLPRVDLLFSEKELSPISHQHWLSMDWKPNGVGHESLGIFDELIFGAIDEHHRDDEAELRDVLADTLAGVLTQPRFKTMMMDGSFANITLAESVVADSARIVHLPIPQSMLHASTESSFKAWFSHPTDLLRSGFLEMSIAFPADMFPGSTRTSCVTNAFQIPVGTAIAEQDMTARWRDVVRLLSDDDEIRVMVKMLKYVPEGIRGVTGDGVIVAGLNP